MKTLQVLERRNCESRSTHQKDWPVESALFGLAAKAKGKSIARGDHAVKALVKHLSHTIALIESQCDSLSTVKPYHCFMIFRAFSSVNSLYLLPLEANSRSFKLTICLNHPLFTVKC